MKERTKNNLCIVVYSIVAVICFLAIIIILTHIIDDKIGSGKYCNGDDYTSSPFSNKYTCCIHLPTTYGCSYTNPDGSCALVKTMSNNECRDGVK